MLIISELGMAICFVKSQAKIAEVVPYCFEVVALYCVEKRGAGFEKCRLEDVEVEVIVEEAGGGAEVFGRELR